tara:strand:- start:5 stop:142 length:138 start_codon:yes stop_codon:yes gene_type:complete
MNHDFYPSQFLNKNFVITEKGVLFLDGLAKKIQWMETKKGKKKAL